MCGSASSVYPYGWALLICKRAVNETMDCPSAKIKQNIHSENGTLRIQVGIDTSKLEQKLDAIARHAKALADELKDIDAFDD